MFLNTYRRFSFTFGGLDLVEPAALSGAATNPYLGETGSGILLEFNFCVCLGLNLAYIDRNFLKFN